MSNNNRKKDYEDDYLETNSFHECTGLIPSAPQSNEEAMNYTDIYPYLPEVHDKQEHDKKGC